MKVFIVCIPLPNLAPRALPFIAKKCDGDEVALFLCKSNGWQSSCYSVISLKYSQSIIFD